MANYNVYERETIINMCDADNYAVVESYQQRWINRILKAKEKAEKVNELYVKEGIEPIETIKILKQTENMIEAIIPRDFIKIKAPNYISGERREKMAERAKYNSFGRILQNDSLNEEDE